MRLVYSNKHKTTKMIFTLCIIDYIPFMDIIFRLYASFLTKMYAAFNFVSYCCFGEYIIVINFHLPSVYGFKIYTLFIIGLT